MTSLPCSPEPLLHSIVCVPVCAFWAPVTKAMGFRPGLCTKSSKWINQGTKDHGAGKGGRAEWSKGSEYSWNAKKVGQWGRGRWMEKWDEGKSKEWEGRTKLALCSVKQTGQHGKAFLQFLLCFHYRGPSWEATGNFISHPPNPLPPVVLTGVRGRERLNKISSTLHHSCFSS